MQLLPRSNSVVSYAAQQIRPVILCFAPHYSLKQRFSQCGSDDLTITVNTTHRVPAQHKTAVTYCVCQCWSISLTRWWLGNLLWCLGFKFAIVCEVGGVRLRRDGQSRYVAGSAGLMAAPTLQSFWYLLHTSLLRPPDASQGLSGGTMLWLTRADRWVRTVDRCRQYASPEGHMCTTVGSGWDDV